ncbi:MAG TPA: hydrogenase maturation protease, partial [Anaerolineae bacterium]|nr:hydrogenase maturation protease [Anaerolineae bacterium]
MSRGAAMLRPYCWRAGMGKTLILGVGNILLSDDGVGVHVVRRLEEVAEFPPEVEVLDGGTKGMDLLHYLEGVSRLIIIDAVETKGPPGTLARLTGDQVPAHLSLKMSPHEIGLPDMLFAAQLRDIYPEEVVILGVQPAKGLSLLPDCNSRGGFCERCWISAKTRAVATT